MHNLNSHYTITVVFHISRFWEYGQPASVGLRQVAEHGATRVLEAELKGRVSRNFAKLFFCDLLDDAIDRFELVDMK